MIGGGVLLLKQALRGHLGHLQTAGAPPVRQEVPALSGCFSLL